jgi:NADH:ubiquinone oxidoreductase subunit E
MQNEKIGTVVVIGGGVGGVQASLDLAESGYKVYLIEEKPAIGGVMAQLDKTFPTNDCSMCILAPKLVEVSRHPNIKIITQAEIESIKGYPGKFTISIKKHPRYVDEERCTGCGTCSNNCPVRNKPYQEIEKPKIELSNEELKRTNSIINRHEAKEESLLAILLDIQEEFNYLPQNILMYIAEQLEVPISRLYSLATFFKAFSLEPKGKHTIKVCMGTACHVRGALKILDAISRVLKIKPGETTQDRMFSLETVNCLGACALSPVVLIDDKYYGRLTPEKIESLLAH